ncbi:MAG: hypothetical protein ACRECH_04905 [Nitrososphaerales archaeon]
MRTLRAKIQEQFAPKLVVDWLGFMRYISKKGGGSTTFEFCDIFEFESEKVKRITTFWGTEVEKSK